MRRLGILPRAGIPVRPWKLGRILRGKEGLRVPKKKNKGWDTNFVLMRQETDIWLIKS